MQKEKLGKAFGAGGGGTTFTKTKHTRKTRKLAAVKNPKTFLWKRKTARLKEKKKKKRFSSFVKKTGKMAIKSLGKD